MEGSASGFFLKIFQSPLGKFFTTFCLNSSYTEGRTGEGPFVLRPLHPPKGCSGPASALPRYAGAGDGRSDQLVFCRLRGLPPWPPQAIKPQPRSVLPVHAAHAPPPRPSPALHPCAGRYRLKHASFAPFYFDWWSEAPTKHSSRSNPAPPPPTRRSISCTLLATR